MIQLYSGVPGAGKTYKMVADLDKFLSENPDVILVSNIRALKLPHTDFDELLNEKFPDKNLTIPQRVDLFFTYEFQQELNSFFGGSIMYVLDECQLYFPRRTSLPNTESYLQRHRHLGHYIYLATQSSKLINSNIVALIEIEYYAVRRALSLFGEMRYRVKSPQSNQLIKHFSIRPKKRIFQLYQSFESEEIKKPKRELLIKMWPLLLIPFASFFFYDRILNTDKKVERLTGQSQASSVITSSSSASPPDGFSSVSSKEEALRSRVDELEKQLEQKFRVFLPVVKTADKMLTIDPETNSVVDIKFLSGRGIKCVDFQCYYDVSVGSIPKAYENQLFGSSDRLYSGVTSYPSYISEASPEPGVGSFIDSSIVPAPERLR